MIGKKYIVHDDDNRKYEVYEEEGDALLDADEDLEAVTVEEVGHDSGFTADEVAALRRLIPLIPEIEVHFGGDEIHDDDEEEIAEEIPEIETAEEETDIDVGEHGDVEEIREEEEDADHLLDTNEEVEEEEFIGREFPRHKKTARDSFGQIERFNRFADRTDSVRDEISDAWAKRFTHKK